MKRPKPKSKILVSGSVVIDKILGKTSFGGTAGNIAYGLGMLGTSPMLFSLVGRDFGKYKKHLEKNNVALKICIDKKEKTANFISEMKKGKRVELWQPNAFKNFHSISLPDFVGKKELKGVELAIFSPGTQESILRHLIEFRKVNKKALAIFDPGQMIQFYERKIFKECMKLSDILILNELEYSILKEILKQEPAEAFYKKTIIKTLGEKGSVILKNGKALKVPAAPPKIVKDTTGAGDAYRAGLIYGLISGKTLKASCLLGAKIAAKNIEFVGCQEYRIP